MNLIRRYFRYIFLLLFLAVIAGAGWLYKKSQEPEPVVIVPREEKTIRILEGWSNREIADYLAEQGLWPAGDFLAAAGSAQIGMEGGAGLDFAALRQRYSWLPEKTASLEGYLFPDTYRIFATSTPQEVIGKMLDNFDRKLTPEMRAEIARQGKTVQEIVTMASLIEKEAPIDNVGGKSEDARLIGGVFYNRLALGQALQSDATLSYVFRQAKARHAGVELEYDSPYNTYRYRGLPPGPIANSGLIAIQAAINPADTDYYYFLTPTDSRAVIYARTYEEHLRNKNKYLQ